VIRKAQKKYGVEFSLIKAVIKVESDFNPEAVSKKGAKGLMQIMPDNFKSLAFGKVKPVLMDRPVLRNAERLLSVFFLKLRELGSLVKEVIICNVQSPQGSLQGLGVDISEPFKLLTLFELCQPQSGIMER